MIWIECEYCDAEYLAERRSRKYCSDSCKTMACRQRRRDEEIAIYRIKEQKKLDIYADQRIEEMRKRRQQLEDEQSKQQVISKLENQQREAENERIAKEAKEKRIADENLNKAAREKENLRNAELIELFAPVVINGASIMLNHFFGGKSEENSQEQQEVSTTTSNDTTPNAN